MNNKRPLGLRLYYLIYYFLDKYYHQRKILGYLHNLQKKKLRTPRVIESPNEE